MSKNWPQVKHFESKMFLPCRAERQDPPLREILDRILDKGIVIEPWARVVLWGIDFRQHRLKVVPDSSRKPFLVKIPRR